MKIIFNLFFIICFMSCGRAQNNNKSDISVADGDQGQIVFLELFTSQGCSSCPPADALFGEFLKEFQSAKNVFAISFHVDYWDKLGWKDPFSNFLFTERQVSYQKIFSKANIYTPQMVVNGKYEFVGSDKTKLKRATSDALSATGELTFTKLNVEFENDIASVEYELNGTSDMDEVFLCLVSLQETTVVKKGENKGKTLNSQNVVRQMLSGKNESKGQINFAKIDGIDKTNLAVVAFVSDKKTMVIKAAGMKRFE